MTAVTRRVPQTAWWWAAAGGALAGLLATAGPLVAVAVFVLLAGLVWLTTGGWDVALRLLPAVLAVFAVTFAPTVLSERFGAPSLMRFVLPAIAAWGLLRTRRDPTSAHDLPGSVFVILLFPMAAAISVFAAVDMTLAGGNLIETIGTSMLAVVLVVWVRSEAGFHSLCMGILAGTSVLAFVNAFQGLTQDFGNTYLGFAVSNASEAAPGDAVRIGGPFDDGNFLSQVLLIGVPIAVWAAIHGRNRPARIAGAGSALAMVVSIALSFSRGGLLAFAALVAIASLISRRRVLWVSAALLGTVLAGALAPPALVERATSITDTLSFRADQIVIEDASTRGRLNEMGSALLMWRDSPAVGVGVGNYEALYLDYSSLLGLDPRRSGRSAHSLYLETLAETGVVGIAMLLITVATGLVTLWRARRRLLVRGNVRTADLVLALWLGFVAYLVAAIFLHDAFEDPLWLLIGASLAVAGIGTGIDRSIRPIRLVHVLGTHSDPAAGRRIVELASNPSTNGVAEHRLLAADGTGPEVEGIPIQTVARARWPRLVQTFQAIRRSNADVIHVHDRRSGLPGIIAGIVLGIPVVLTDHSPSPGLGRRLLDWFSLDRVIRSEVGPTEAAGLAKVATQSIPDAVEEPVTTASAMARFERRLGRASGPVLVVAGDGSSRAIETTSRALDTVFATYPDARVLLMEGAHDVSRSAIRHDPAERRLHVLSRDEIGAGLATAHLFIDASTEVPDVEGTASALASGMAVVVTDHPATEDLADDAFAIRVPPGHPEILSNAIIFALSNPSGLIRRGQLARQRTIERFGRGAWAETVHAVYRDVADGRPVTH